MDVARRYVRFVSPCALHANLVLTPTLVPCLSPFNKWFPPRTGLGTLFYVHSTSSTSSFVSYELDCHGPDNLRTPRLIDGGGTESKTDHLFPNFFDLFLVSHSTWTKEGFVS